MKELESKVALVVGAGCIAEGMGNGRATAMTFAREGATVICADINGESAQETARLIRDEGFEASSATLDVTDLGDVERVVAEVMGTHGRIDVLDNNVGIASVGGVTDLHPDEWERVFKINLSGAFNTMRVVIPHMSAAGGGSIVNISSVAGIRWSGVPYASYYASKAALNHLSRTTAVEFAPKRVRVNAVLPGLMKTPMVATSGLAGSYSSESVDAMWRKRDRQVPLGHMGDPWDVANAALFLASDRAKYVTGIELVVDGGLSVGFSAPV
ncbi:glucose 1-dehydrogenase [Paeniglutamicibacter psychrophenolicus]|uniref:NAD(P)-dependent dehydrogenase (Short-subunit alcohol dehydrogenase family) n=1 Tax=Paeniglutamicibacter psychrophenolicus TaxID=257454 RepID=A0ABS4WHB8_9MICC|nr:SDR family NAD(P)-dependent oxidoreductase [Paeniglutamicibacter psychrophenolicus]MBP2375601.1 NAD(P)-dependent dehydrogenase (short-subunit alcohol dehydrogenase family) [Paeniglutamicibacter psychrophenolicus]